MSKELLRDDSLPYREYLVRPGDALDFGIEWANWLANRWFSGIPFAAGSVIRPRASTGFEYLTVAGGMTGAAEIPSVEPDWLSLINLGDTLVDGAVTWTKQAISNASLVSTVSGSVWTPDSPITVSGQSLAGSRAMTIATMPSNIPDGDYYLFNVITLANTVQKTGTFLLRSRAKKI
jgi:hypothetical protein